MRKIRSGSATIAPATSDRGINRVFRTGARMARVFRDKPCAYAFWHAHRRPIGGGRSSRGPKGHGSGPHENVKGRKKGEGGWFAQLPRAQLFFRSPQLAARAHQHHAAIRGALLRGVKALDSVRTYVVMQRILSVIFYNRPLRREKEQRDRVRRRTNNAVA